MARAIAILVIVTAFKAKMGCPGPESADRKVTASPDPVSKRIMLA
jgi:hypothetical protein